MLIRGWDSWCEGSRKRGKSRVQVQAKLRVQVGSQMQFGNEVVILCFVRLILRSRTLILRFLQVILCNFQEIMCSVQEIFRAVTVISRFAMVRDKRRLQAPTFPVLKSEVLIGFGHVGELHVGAVP